MKKRIKPILITIIVLVVAGLIALPKLSSSGNDNQTAKNRNTTLPVRAHIVKNEKLANNITTSGTILANEEVELMSEVAGKIVNIFFKEGSSIKKGDLLIKINDSELQAQLEKTKFNLKLLEDREYRQKVLLEREAISKEDYEVSLNELNVVKADIGLINAQIDKTELRSPFDGVIGLKNVSEGSFVNTNTIIATLQNINPVKIDFSIPEKYSGSVKIGDAVKFKVVGNNEVYIGKVYAIEPKIDPLTRTLKMRALYSNPNRNIFPGSFADVDLILDEIDNALMVPTYSIVPELKGQKIFLYKNGNAVPQSVEIGIRTDTTVQITKGLKENDTIIVSGILQVKPGMPVIISEFN
ncbi:MAG TPA: efflux RND transporter periplasmic adaptor subunit [Ignavibacteriaceae bacterium]|nr:efflux RND transporter periplasmic adaptor subunit [Ignavibacteriaceae bacterium]